MQTTNPVPGTIGAYVDTKIKTRTSLFARAVEHKDRVSTKWQGPKKRGGGFNADVTPPPTFRATTAQSCAFNPLVWGARAPKVGAPVGAHFDSGELVGCDPLSYFLANMIQNPSIAFMSNPAAGKSTAMRVMMIGMAAHGVVNMVIGDLKDEHGETIRSVGGNKVSISPADGTLNVLDPGGIIAALALVNEHFPEGHPIGDKVRRKLLEDMHMRRTEAVCSLVSIHRGRQVVGVEDTMVGRALNAMYEADPQGVPIMSDLLDSLTEPSDELLRIAAPRKDLTREQKMERYFEKMDELLSDLASLCASDTLGKMFNGHTSVVDRDGNRTDQLDYDKGLAFDISGIDTNQPQLLAAAYTATWAVAFGLIYTSHRLADAGLAPRRQFMAWLDEFWQPLTASKGMVDRTSRMGRTNRTAGVGIAYAIHTLDDLEALPDEEDRNKARGLIKRCGMQWIGGLPYDEVMKVHQKLTRLTDSEIEQLVRWYNPQFKETGGWIPGRGCFLLKLGEETGIPIRVVLTPTEQEKSLHETSQRLIDAV